MKARIVVAGLLVSMVVAEASAQRAEYDDMYFRAKDRDRSKSIDAEEAYASAKITRQKQDDAVVVEDNTNPTDSYSARNVNPEYVSRANSEKASEDESNYYLEGYTPPSSLSGSDFNNSYYNNTSPAANSYYGNNNWNSPYYGNCGYCGTGMSPYYGGGYSPWMSPAYGFGPSYGWTSGLSISLMYGNYWNPYGGYGYGNPYYGGYGYPAYYGGNGYYEAPRTVNYGKRPSRHSAVVQPTQRTDTRTRNTQSENLTSVSSNNRTRQRQAQDEYYVRPARRSSSFSNPSPWSFGGSDNNSLSSPQNNQPSRSRDTYNQSSRTPSYTPSSSPSYSPSRSSGSSGGSGGGSSPRPRGRN